ncbi:MAG: zinc ribbon domain-containing protein [Nitrospinae bacterium]|nr:zinc ribbon domain-containing protein [Nitrospinota bacterium]
MPIYEYVCAKCGEHMEVNQKISDAPLKKHSGGCGGKLTKLISANAFHLKGTGWYKTDYPKSGSGGAKKESPSSGGTETKTSSTTVKPD